MSLKTDSHGNYIKFLKVRGRKYPNHYLLQSLLSINKTTACGNKSTHFSVRKMSAGKESWQTAIHHTIIGNFV